MTSTPAREQGEKGTPADKLRLALVQLLTCEALPSEPDFDRTTAALAAAGADPAALAYMRRMRRMNLTGRAAAAAAGEAAGGGGGALAGLAGQSHLLSWADKTFGQGLSSLTKGVPCLCLARLEIAAVCWAPRSGFSCVMPAQGGPAGQAPEPGAHQSNQERNTRAMLVALVHVPAMWSVMALPRLHMHGASLFAAHRRCCKSQAPEDTQAALPRLQG